MRDTCLFVSSFLFLIPICFDISNSWYFNFSPGCCFSGNASPIGAWAAVLVVINVGPRYSQDRWGLKAIVYSVMSIQGVIMLAVIWIIGVTCPQDAGKELS